MQFVWKIVKNQCKRHPRVIDLPERTWKTKKDQIMPAPGGWEHPIQLSRRDPLICRYHYKAIFLSGAMIRAWGPPKCPWETAMQRRPWPKSLRGASLRSRLRMWASCSAQSEQALTLDLQTSLQTTFFSCAMIRGYLDNLKDDTFVFPSKIHFFLTIEFIPTFSQRRWQN